MKRILAAGFVLGFSTALLCVSGCSDAARRTLTIVQYLTTDNMDEEFPIDTSELPADAIAKRTNEAKAPAEPEIRLELNPDYKFEIVIRLAKSETVTAPPSR
jgi:hypothetical protein